MISYGFSKVIDTGFDEALKNIEVELKKQGFGVLTRIDVHEKFKEKLGVDFKKYVILGACHPSSAHQAILVEENIGLMLPCNVLVYETEDHVNVSIIKPKAAMGMIQNPELDRIAEGVDERLRKAFDSIT